MPPSGTGAPVRCSQSSMLINTSRGGLIDTRAVIAGLKTGRIGALGLDVYEEEEDLFFEDLSGQVFVIFILTVAAAEAALAARLYTRVARARGREIDLAIAACAIANNAAIWTLNRDDFRDVPDLRLV